MAQPSQETEMNYTHADVMNGLSIFGAAMQLEPPQIFPGFLSGDYDSKVSVALFFRLKSRLPETAADLQLPEVLDALERAKAVLRMKIGYIFRQAEREAADEKQAQLEQVRVELAARNKPSITGTVAEISEKFGISKSEIRRRRADGTLEEHLTRLSLTQGQKS